MRASFTSRTGLYWSSVINDQYLMQNILSYSASAINNQFWGLFPHIFSIGIQPLCLKASIVNRNIPHRPNCLVSCNHIDVRISATLLFCLYFLIYTALKDCDLNTLGRISPGTLYHFFSCSLSTLWSLFLRFFNTLAVSSPKICFYYTMVNVLCRFKTLYLFCFLPLLLPPT